MERTTEIKKRMDTQSTKLRRTFTNANIVESDTSLTEAKGHRDILRSILAALGKWKITEFVERFGDRFTYTDQALNLQFTDKGGLSEFLKKSREQFPDAKVEVVSTFESGNSAIAEWRVTATEKVAYGSMQVRLPISFSGVSIAQIRNKRIVRWSDYYDQAQSRRIGVAAYFTDWIEL
jgi:SnoaL-like domain